MARPKSANTVKADKRKQAAINRRKGHGAKASHEWSKKGAGE